MDLGMRLEELLQEEASRQQQRLDTKGASDAAPERQEMVLHIVSGGLSVLLRTRRQSYAHVRNRSRGQRRRSQSITSTYWTDHKSRATAEGDALGRPRPKSTIARYRLSRVGVHAKLSFCFRIEDVQSAGVPRYVPVPGR